MHQIMPQQNGGKAKVREHVSCGGFDIQLQMHLIQFNSIQFKLRLTIFFVFITFYFNSHNIRMFSFHWNI
jgi:hypothetical protein